MTLIIHYRDTNGGAKMSNGYPDQNNSPNSSQLSGEHSDHGGPTLISRTQKQHTTQQVTYRYMPIPSIHAVTIVF